MRCACCQGWSIRKKSQSSSPGVTWWDNRKNDGIQLSTISLPSLFSVQELEALEALNRETLERIDDGEIPRTSIQKPYIVLIHSEYTSTECVSSLKRIATIVGIVPTEDHLVLINETKLFLSSRAETDSLDKEENLSSLPAISFSFRLFYSNSYTESDTFNQCKGKNLTNTASTFSSLNLSFC